MKFRVLAVLALLLLSVSALSAKAHITYFCWYLDNTPCTTVGETQACLDETYALYGCTCHSSDPGLGQPPLLYWDCPELP